MTKIADTTNVVTLDDALYTLAAQARTRYAGEHQRIDRGLVIALNHGVTLHQDGTADVQSASDPEIVYHIAHGTCDCPDASSRAPEGRCKHRWAVCLTKRAQQATAYYTTTTDSQGLVLGGHRATADAQRAQEEAEGGLVARICGYAKTVTTVAATAVLAVSLLAGSVDAKPRPALAARIEEIRLVGSDTREYRVPVTVNDAGPYWGLLDTGATGVMLPYPVYLALWRQGAISSGDSTTPTTVTIADGRTLPVNRVVITLTLGAYRLSNVVAMIGTQDSDFLIGSNVLQRFQSFGIDHTRGILRLGQPR